MHNFKVDLVYLPGDISFKELISKHIDYADKRKAANKREVNELKKLMKFLGETLGGTSNHYLISKWEQTYQKYKSHLVKDKKQANQTVSNALSRLSAIRKTLFKYINGKTPLPEDFSESLKVLCARFNSNINQINKECGGTFYTIQKWIEGGHKPQVTSFDIIKKVESYFCLPERSLLSKVNNPKGIKKLLKDCAGEVAPKSKYQEHLSKASKSRYRLKYWRWPSNLQDEMVQLVEHKTTDVLGLSFDRNTVWRVTKDVNSIYDFSNCPSAEYRKYGLEAFYGFLMLKQKAEEVSERGYGVEEKDLTMTLVYNYDLVENFVLNFLSSRSTDGRPNKFAKGFVNFCSNILEPEKGFLYQNSDLARKLPNYKHLLKDARKYFNKKKKKEDFLFCDEWDVYWKHLCEVAWEKYIALGKRIKKFIDSKETQSRDVYSQNKEVLDLEMPANIIRELLQRLESLAPIDRSANKGMRTYMRDYLLISFLEAIPLRARSLSVIKVDENLIREEDGYRLKLSKNELKNGGEKVAKNGLNVTLPKHMTKILDAYLNIYYESFLEEKIERKKNSYLFRTTGRSRYLPVSASYLSDRIEEKFRLLMPEVVAMRAQAFRHVIATDIMRNVPGGLEIAADVLLDDPKTVSEYYSWVQPGEKYSKYKEQLEEKVSGKSVHIGVVA